VGTDFSGEMGGLGVAREMGLYSCNGSDLDGTDKHDSTFTSCKDL